MECIISSPHSQAPDSCPLSWARSVLSVTPHHTSRRFIFSIILPSTPRFSTWSLFLGSPHKKFACNSVSYTCHMSRPSHFSWFDCPRYIWWWVHVTYITDFGSVAADDSYVMWHNITGKRNPDSTRSPFETLLSRRSQSCRWSSCRETGVVHRITYISSSFLFTYVLFIQFILDIQRMERCIQ